MAAGGAAVSGRLLQLHNGCSDHALAIDLASPFSCTEHKQYIQLTLLTLFWHPLSLISHCWGNKLFVCISIRLCVAFKHLGTVPAQTKIQATSLQLSLLPNADFVSPILLQSHTAEEMWCTGTASKAHLCWQTKTGEPTSWTESYLCYFICVISPRPIRLINFLQTLRQLLGGLVHG